MKRTAIILICLLTGACVTGPDYRRPEIDLPERWDDANVAAPELATWWRQLGDPVLNRMIDEGLEYNNNLKAAAANVEAAAAELRLARQDYYPSGSVQAGTSRYSNAGNPFAGESYNQYRTGLIVNYEIDVWGRIRRANEAALAELGASAATRDAVRSTIAAGIARAYFQVLALDRQITLLEQTLVIREQNLQLQRARLDAGMIAAYAYEQARAETAAVRAELPALRNARAAAGTALSILRGDTPRAMLAGWAGEPETAAERLPEPPAVPTGLPSDLLQRRPDIRAAEQQLIAANARIGETRAAAFPRISLTGFAGGISTALSSLLDSDALNWEASLLADQSVSVNRLEAAEDAATSLRDAAAAAYAGAVQTAFKEVLDALSALAAFRDIELAEEERVGALTRAYEVVSDVYEAGGTGYLELLDVERQLRQVELAQVEARFNLLNATIDLYRALGGGWEPSARAGLQ